MKKFLNNLMRAALVVLIFSLASCQEEFEKIVEQARVQGIDSSEVKGLIQQFSNKYIWFLFEYAGPSLYDIDAVTKRIKEELSSKKELSEKDTLPTRDEIMEKYPLSKKVIDLSTVARACALMQDDRKMINSQACYYVNGLLINHLSKTLSIDVALMKYIDTPLLEEYVRTENIDSLKQELEKRSTFFIVTRQDNTSEIMSGEKGKKHLSAIGFDYKPDIQADIQSIHGQVAYKGHATGIVKVLKHIGERDKFKKGDILVTHMTTPDFVSLMKKASAIITDEGGITCHAAIVSRELGIPCIIGTEIATKILKDNTHVEVDADNGVVKILDKKKNG